MKSLFVRLGEKHGCDGRGENVVGWFVGYLEALFEDREVVVLAQYEREVECFLM